MLQGRELPILILGQHLNGFYYFDCFRMGNSARNPEDYEVVRNYRADEWEQMPSSNGELWRSRKTHELAKVHRLFSVPSSIDMDRYELRSSQENFVKVYYIALASRQSLCFNEPFVRLLVEFIPVRLKEVDSLELEEALTLLAAVIKGFHALTAHFGAIEPQEELIGFNQWGKAKVWLNKDISCNFPEHASQVNFDKSRVEASHVRKLFDLVQRKCQTGQLPLGLKELFRAHNPGFLQAILIVEQYSYQNQLSLQRYIRTDIVVRKTSALALTRQPSHNRINNSQIIVEREFKRMHSVDALHTQRWTNVSHSTVSIPNVQFKENISFNSATQGYRSPITKVSFQRSRQPYNLLPLHNVSSLCSPTRLVELRSEQASPSTLGSPQRSIFQPSPIKVEPPHKKMNIFPQVQEQLLVQTLKKEETQQQPHLQLSSQVVSKEILQHHHQSLSDHEQETPFQAGHQSHRSIIDKVNIELMSAEETTPIQTYQQQEFQVSGTFNFKPINERDQFQHLHYPLQQIGEEEDCSKDRECDSDSKIKEPEEQKWIERDQINNLPIGFQSFAPNKLKQLQTVSFAPNINNYPTQQSIRSEENVKTSQSFEYDEKWKESEKEDSIQEQFQDRALQSSESVHPYQQPTQQNEEERRALQAERLLQARKRVSIDLYYQQQNPLFRQCTPIQSKFDVLVKRDSVFSRESQREERPSAFGQFQTDEEIENYVRNKYGTYLSENNKYQEEVKVGRVQSQYQKHYVKQTEGHDFARKEVRPSIEIACPPRSNKRISYILEKPEEDFLDVNFLEKSLDKRYSNPKKTRAREDEDELNIAKLDEGLMKFSTSKVSFADQSSKDGQQESISHRSKWEATTGFQCPPAEEKKKRTVRIEATPTHQFNYQLSNSNYAQPARTTAKSPEIARQTTKTGKVSQAQKESIDARYDKYVKNNKQKPSQTPSIAQIAGIRGESRLMLSPIPERRGEEEGRLSYDQLRSFLWG